MGGPIDDKTKEIYRKLEGKKYIEDEFTKEYMKTRALTKEALDIVADYSKGEHEKKCSAVDEARKIMKDEEQLVKEVKKQIIEDKINDKSHAQKGKAKANSSSPAPNQQPAKAPQAEAPQQVNQKKQGLGQVGKLQEKEPEAKAKKATKGDHAAKAEVTAFKDQKKAAPAKEQQANKAKPEESKDEQVRALQAKSGKKELKMARKQSTHAIEGKKFTEVQDEDFEKEQRQIDNELKALHREDSHLRQQTQQELNEIENMKEQSARVLDTVETGDSEAVGKMVKEFEAKKNQIIQQEDQKIESHYKTIMMKAQKELEKQ